MRYPDPTDRAQATAEQFTQQAINAARSKPGASTLAECIDCGIEIPEKRRKAAPGCTRCVGCQQEHERLNMMGG